MNPQELLDYLFQHMRSNGSFRGKSEEEVSRIYDDMKKDTFPTIVAAFNAGVETAADIFKPHDCGYGETSVLDRHVYDMIMNKIYLIKDEEKA